MTLIDGKKVSAEIKEQVAAEVETLKQQTGQVPGLAVVLVGEDPASAVYVRNKNKTCGKMGFHSFSHTLSADTQEGELLKLIAELNANPEVNGILVQLPLPKQINEQKVLEAIDPAKDVDGFHPVNVGYLTSGADSLAPCTPAGIIEMLDHYKIEIEGRNAVILGRSNIVGKPMASLLLKRHATVTICHSRTQDLAGVARSADILVAAIGKPRFVTADMVKEGAVVIDVGINRVDGKLVGDVDFDAAAEKAAFMTPVPGGVGPMTIAMLMKNTLKAFKNAHNL
ncbi:MAG: bifunctional methylenetetrahydrofolate dehydrogenase/methenyltetrahydrofolate cyclohydrolase FolD [Nitrospinaceae bacterium]|nr:bifunctional methylenetetrahydrofolate dehydrogenase/methenyltetrahydrofolate cyclohydrolase FolD [Nitrospinaceae bacterium]NIR54902.1 bifunctional methylenetetrahydrofolate dehydrogenase/methenyltetrahydrofolate cyclohydrolase FolD [Nitrospinaceae bacterium]NIS85330.1 bifunctional methylenetetrahydrofolate dehydrogenase/methenyltetrahydrofolate cyclohydrolase FolD [Nitrospinaceae bacterium]NIT82140.1 bifunctional methylenetetrahydrofolate dehydrogenase/methenyltetrahydrofolate cyclohydrolase